MNHTKPGIFEYLDFRKYLDEFRRANGYSHEYLCSALGRPRSRSYFNDIVKGRKQIGPDIVERFVNFLSLSAVEARYFKALVSYTQAARPHEKEYWFDIIIGLNCTPRKNLNTQQRHYYSAWYHSVVRAALDVFDVDGESDLKRLAESISPKITLRSLKESLALLQKLDLIQRDSRGYLKPKDKVVSSGETVEEALLRQYQLKTLELAKTALLAERKTKCRNVTATVAVSSDALERIAKKIEQFKQEIRSIVHKDQKRAQKVYHINLTAFPHIE
jgi:uncharacterized protein (TIGR02147 family)